MARRKKEEKKDKFPGYEELSRESVWEGDRFPVPQGATDVAFEMDYSGCWYESDRPTNYIYFLKKKT